MTTTIPLSQPKDLKRLAGLGLLGLVLLAGRFDWWAVPKPALTGYTLSAFMFLLLLTGSFAFARAQAWSLTRQFWIGLTTGTVLLNFPLHLLLPNGWFYYAGHPHSYARQPVFVPEWIGTSPPWTGTDWFFLGLLAAGIAGFALWLQRRKLSVSDADDPRLSPFHILGLFLLILGQIWLHHSNRSPYSYVPHFEQPLSKHYTSTLSLLPNDHGLTNADVDYYTRLEELFLGSSESVPTLFIRRAFVFYLSGNLSFFVGPYHSFLLLNLLLWMAAVLAFYRLVTALTDRLVAGYGSALLALSPGFIMFAGQPMSYFAGYAAVILMLYGAYRGLTAPHASSFAAVYATGVILGLAMLTTDLFVWVPTVVLFAFILRRSWLHALFASFIGLGAYGLYIWLVFGFLRLPHDNLNDRQLFEAVTVTLDALRHPFSPSLYLALAGFPGEYLRQLGHAFFILPVFLAAAGLFWSDLNQTTRRAAALWLLPSLMTFFVMYLGHSFLGSLPRFNFVAYPAIFLLGGAFLAWCERAATAGNWPRAGRLAAGGLVALCGVQANCDALGLLPHQYYYFYYSSGGYFS